jgi:hypothetical protein
MNPVMRYLTINRKLDKFTGSPAIRMATLTHSDSGRTFPAMVAAVQSPSGHIAGVHVTYIRHDGNGKADVEPARKMFGQCWRGAVRFDRAAETLALAEGLESALSVRQATGLPTWAALSLGNLAGAGKGEGAPHPQPKRVGQRLPSVIPDMKRPGIVLPDIVREVVLFRDNDEADKPAADCLIERAVNRFCALGFVVRVVCPPAGQDFNDVLRGVA